MNAYNTDLALSAYLVTADYINSENEGVLRVNQALVSTLKDVEERRWDKAA